MKNILGIAHAHTTFSHDGKLTIAELRDFLVMQGMQFVLLSEHYEDFLTRERLEEFIFECQRCSDDNFLVVPGVEIPIGKNHILALGIKDPLENILKFEESLEEAYEKEAYIVWAHPHRGNYQLTAEHLIKLDAVEIWNSQYDGKKIPRYRAYLLYNKLQKIFSNLQMFAGLDLHRKTHFFGPVMQLKVDELRQERIISELRNGGVVFRRFDGKEIFQSNREPLFYFSNRLKSFFTIYFITFSRWINKLLKFFHLSLPTGFKDRVRRII